ncbi:unnamed protein product, partial [Brachionus calyciflorus]
MGLKEVPKKFRKKNGSVDGKEDGSFKPIAYFSKNYTLAERNYATPEKELLSVVKSI